MRVDPADCHGGAAPGGSRAPACQPDAGTDRGTPSFRPDAIPFEELFDATVAAAAERAWRIIPTAGILTTHARTQLERALARRLARITDRALLAEFTTFRAAAVLSRQDAIAFDPGSHHLYDEFVRHMCRQHLAPLFRSYPVARQLVEAAAADWVQYAVELVERLRLDLPSIAESLASGRPTGSVTDVTIDLSDPHLGGRTVARLQFASGLAIVYKPRNVRLDTAAEQLIGWLNRHRTGPLLKLPLGIDRGTYGWKEAIEARPWSDAGERTLYYRRGGMLLCLAYIFGAGDLHRANVIAHGSFPIPVDLEVFFAGSRAATRGGSVGPTGDGVRLGWDSVLRTGLLPARRQGRSGHEYVDGGLLPLLPQAPSARWRFPNSDWMSLPAPGRAGGTDGGRHALGPLAAHLDDVVAGFAEMYAVLRAHRGELLSDRGPLRAFVGLSYRVVLRNTSTYALLIERTTHPRALASDAARQTELARLGAVDGAQDDAIVRAEREALDRLDVPIFWAECDGVSVRTEGGRSVDGLMMESGVDGVRRRLRAMNDEDIRVQSHAIRLATAQAGESRRIVHPGLAAASREDVLRTRALGIAARLVDTHCLDASGSPTWVAVHTGTASSSGLRMATWDWYGGRMGAAFFLAAAGAFGDQRARDLAGRVAAPLIDRTDTDWAAAAEKNGLGIGAGIGGVIYALARASAWAGRDAWASTALRAARAITAQRVDEDIRQDVVFGSAGALLGVLALHDVTAEAWLVGIAERCSRTCRRPVAQLRGSGMAHGRIGVAYALARLFAVTGHSDVRKASLALAELPYEADPALPASWCRGHTGWVLGRLACASLLDAPELRDGVLEAADAIAEDHGHSRPADHICCGALGHGAALAAAAAQFGRPDYQQVADTAIDALLARADERATFRLGTLHDIFAPGLFQGLAGIGYELLRLAEPRLPSVMLLE